MTKDEILAKVKALNLPKGAYVVFGSCPMAVVGLREAHDIDMLVSPQVFAQLKAAGWKVLDKGGKDRPLGCDVFEAHDNWNFSSYNPALSGLLKSATVIEGVPFASLSEVKKWKTAYGRPKDFEDIKLIEEYLGRAQAREYN